MPQGKVTVGARRRADHPAAARPAAADRAHRRRKGKSTAAFGLALRAWTAGWPVGVFQFVKSAKWRVGEETALRALASVHASTGQGAPVAWHKMGEGWSWLRGAETTTRRGPRGLAADPARPGRGELPAATSWTSSPTR